MAGATLASVLLLCTAAPGAAGDRETELSWLTVVDNDDDMPGAPGVRFNSYNQPSVNDDGVVVLRARSKGPQPVHGIYLRDMGRQTAAARVMDRSTTVPPPNNEGSSFVEFPSFPRIDASTPTVVSRGQSPPVWRYSVTEGIETVAGTSGIFTTAGGTLLTGMSLLGDVAGFDHFSVPNMPSVTRFEVFPGAPAVTNGSYIVFKGNYSEGNARATGAFFRNVADPTAPVVRLATTGMPIPGHQRAEKVFGSVGPPSAAARQAVFVAWDDEDEPTAGGIYRSDLKPGAELQTLVAIGSRVPGQAQGTTFRQFGEGVAFDGRFVAFWGTWGSQTRTVTLWCPDEGNAERREYCLENDDGAVREVPVHQGVFVHDTRTGETTPVATTGDDIFDFRYWGYSGHPPGSGSGEEGHEPPAWRSSAFVAVSSARGGFHVAYKATSQDGTDRIDLASQATNGRTASMTVAETGVTPASVFDRSASATAVVTAVGLEREGLRGRWLVLTVSTGDVLQVEEGMAGVYVTKVPRDLGGRPR